MIQPLTKLVLILVCLFAGAVATTLAAIHARPLDPTLVSLLDPSPGCSSSRLCFMGIRPGGTTMQDATETLSAHPWVEQIDVQSYTQVSWTWSGAQPAYIDGSVPGMIIQRGYSSVSLIRIQTRYNYGDIWLQLGIPETGYVSRQSSGVLHGSYYWDYRLLAINFTECPALQTDFWNTPVAIQFGDAYVMLDRRYQARSAPYRAC